jgi:endonuclease G
MFGKFENIEAFLDSYVKEQEQKKMEYIHSLSLEKQIEVLSSAPVANVAEVKATIKERQHDDLSNPKHYQMTIVLNQIVQFTPEIKIDIDRCQKDHAPVFVAIRYGDRMGIMQPITHGMNTGDTMHFKGQWITKDKAYSHGGVKMSVLHFTHHPIGFTCTVDKCYS